MTLRRIAAVLLLAPFAACRCGSAPAARSETHAPDASAERLDLGALSLVPPAGWARVDVATLPTAPGVSVLAAFAGSSRRAPGIASVALVPRDSPWDNFTGTASIFSEAEQWTVAETSPTRALLVAEVPEPWTRRERLRWFIVGDAAVMFGCELVDDVQQTLCDAQLERLRLTEVDAGSPFRFEAPAGWTEQPIPPGAWPGKMFTLEEQPGFRVSVASTTRCKKGAACEPPSATLNRLSSRRNLPDGGSVEPPRRVSHDGFPGVEVVHVGVPGHEQVAVQVWRFATPKGDILVTCGGQRTADVDAACEATRSSVQLH
jgi:hypothetical protein